MLGRGDGHGGSPCARVVLILARNAAERRQNENSPAAQGRA